MLDKNYRKMRQRLTLVAGVLFLVLGLFALRAFSVQVIYGNEHLEMSNKQTKGIVTIQPRRGSILDQKGRILVSNSEVWSLEARPKMMTDDDFTHARQIIAKIFGKDSKPYRALNRKKSYVWVQRHLSSEQDEAFRKLIADLPEEKRPKGIKLVKEDKRFYPAGALAAPILGFTDIDLKGRRGIEKYFDDDLKGQPITVSGYKNPSGSRISLESLDKSQEIPIGDSIELTLDKAIQFVCERTVRETVLKHKAHEGIIIAMKPSTGDILAMAQYPAYDPNDVRNSSAAYRQNYAIEHTYEPGSTMKPFLISKALNEGLYISDDKLYCGFGEFEVDSHIIHDSKPHGWLTISEVLAKSSNVCTAKIGLELGVEKVGEMFESYGFGTPTGIRLPAEVRGLVNPTSKWVKVDLATASFGQGVNLTGVQLVSAMAAIANDGVMMKPRIVKRVVTASGAEKKRFEPVEMGEIVSKETAHQIQKMLEMAVAPGGTGTKGQVEHCPIAAKTGTAEKLAKNIRNGGKRDFWTSSFLGYFPAYKPEVAMLVLIDEPRNKQYYGGDVAAPAFAQVVTEIAPLMGVCIRRTENSKESN